MMSPISALLCVHSCERREAQKAVKRRGRGTRRWRLNLHEKACKGPPGSRCAGAPGTAYDWLEERPLAVLARVLDDLVDIRLRDEARTGTDVLRPIRRLEAVSLQAFLELRIRLQDLPDLRRIGRVFFLHDRQHGDG